MKKLLVLLLFSSFCQATAQPAPTPSSSGAGAGAGPAPTCTLDWLTAHLTVREATGRNDGPAVAAIIRAGGGQPQHRPEWCGFTQAAAQRACGLPIPLGGMQGAARAWFPAGRRLVYHRAARVGSLDAIAVGQKAGFDYGAGIHHVAAVAELGRAVRAGRAPRSVWTLAGNEGTGAGAGLHRTLYPIGAIDALSDWSR